MEQSAFYFHYLDDLPVWVDWIWNGLDWCEDDEWEYTGWQLNEEQSSHDMGLAHDPV